MMTEEGMKVKSIINGDLAPDLDCPICYEVLTDPRVFRTCQHTFCSKCVYRLIEQAIVGDVPIIYCPICRAPERNTTEMKLESADRWADYFPKNRLLFNIIDSLKTEEEYCQLHEHKLYEYFCEDHNTLCCSRCLLLSHRQCEVVTELRDLTGNENHWRMQLIVNATAGKLGMKTMEDKKRNFLDETQDAMTDLREFRSKFNEAIDQVEKKINGTVKDTLKDIENRKLKMWSQKVRLQSKAQASDISDQQKVVGLLKEVESTETEIANLMDLTQETEEDINSIVSTAMSNVLLEVTDSHRKIMTKEKRVPRNLRFNPYCNQDRPLDLKMRPSDDEIVVIW